MCFCLHPINWHSLLRVHFIILQSQGILIENTFITVTLFKGIVR